MGKLFSKLKDQMDLRKVVNNKDEKNNEIENIKINPMSINVKKMNSKLAK